jgi:hypothetical protein
MRCIDIPFYFKVLGERSKNHQMDSEEIENAGIIPYQMDPKAQLNPGLFYELYLGLLNSNCPRLFQRARRSSETFNIHSLDVNCLFDNSPLGEHTIDKMLPTLCEVLGKPKYTNHSIRVTGLRTLRKFDLPVDVMLKFSGMKLFFPNYIFTLLW